MHLHPFRIHSGKTKGKLLLGESANNPLLLPHPDPLKDHRVFQKMFLQISQNQPKRKLSAITERKRFTERTTLPVLHLPLLSQMKIGILNREIFFNPPMFTQQPHVLNDLLLLLRAITGTERE